MQVKRDKPDFCYDCCPLAHKSTGFVLDAGDPKTARMAVMLEAAGGEEIVFSLSPEKGRRFYETKEQCDEEISTRKRDYPNLPESFIRRGVPICGKSGFEMVQWAFPAAGIRRSELFVANTLRCKPAKHGDSNYPLGDERKKAEACCRHYDRWNLFQPDVAIVSLHPAGIVRDPVGLWLQVKNFEKARDFVKSGLKTLVLAGGKAAKWWLGYGENVTRFQGTYEWNDAAAQQRRADRLERYATVVVREKGQRREKKDVVTVKRGRRSLNAVEALFD